MRSTLTTLCAERGIPLSAQQADLLCAFGQTLLQKNQVMNLTAVTEPDEVAERHFVDSLELLRLTDFREKAVIDVGCGAGFPGVPLKIGEPTLRLTLLDSLGKRIAWLRELLPELGIEANAVCARAEDAVRAGRECYDVAVSRAVARLNVLCELCLPFVKVGGVFLAMKGASALEEADEAKAGIVRLGGRLERVAEYPNGGAVHRVLVIRKVQATPVGYPRAYAKIKQRPL